MLSRHADVQAAAAPLIARLYEIFEATHPGGEIESEEKVAYAREAIQLWWRLYDLLVFWAQCELVGRDLLAQRPGLIAIWRERNKVLPHNDHHFAEALGYRFSRGGRVSKNLREQLAEVVGDGQIDLLKFIAKAGLSEPGQFVHALFLREGTGNAYLRAELRRASGLEDVPDQLTEKEVDPGDDPIQPGKMLWKLEALRQVRILVGRGYKKIAATREIGAAIAHTVDTLQGWERDLVKFSDLENDLFCAELVGELDDQFRTSHFTNIRNYQHYGSFEGMLNIERAARLSRSLRHMRISDIRAALRNVR